MAFFCISHCLAPHPLLSSPTPPIVSAPSSWVGGLPIAPRGLQLFLSERSEPLTTNAARRDTSIFPIDHLTEGRCHFIQLPGIRLTVQSATYRGRNLMYHVLKISAQWWGASVIVKEITLPKGLFPYIGGQTSPNTRECFDVYILGKDFLHRQMPRPPIYLKGPSHQINLPESGMVEQAQVKTSDAGLLQNFKHSL